MTPGQQIVKNHFGSCANSFDPLARDIDAALTDKDNVVKLISKELEKVKGDKNDD